MVAGILATVRVGGAIQAGGIGQADGIGRAGHVEQGPGGVAKLLSMRLCISLWLPGPQLYMHTLVLALWANHTAA